MEYAADALSDIAHRMHEIRKEENRCDPDWRTASTSDLDAVAATYGLERNNYETDETLRGRIGVILKQKLGYDAL